jgi:hypothetical protein
VIEVFLEGICIEPRSRRQLARASKLQGPFAFYDEIDFTIK